MSAIKSVKKEVFIEAEPLKVWNALTIPSERNKWETKTCEIQLYIGGKIDLDYGWGVSFSGTIINLEENKRLVIEDENKDLTIWTICPKDNGSIVTIEYTGLWSTSFELMEMENMLFGTYQFMRNLKSVLETKCDIRSSFWLSWIGITHKTTNFNNSTAIEVISIISETPAVGLIEKEDIITHLNGSEILHYDDFEKTITELGPFKEVSLSIIRNGKKVFVSLETLPYGEKVIHTS